MIDLTIKNTFSTKWTHPKDDCTRLNGTYPPEWQSSSRLGSFERQSVSACMCVCMCEQERKIENEGTWDEWKARSHIGCVKQKYRKHGNDITHSHVCVYVTFVSKFHRQIHIRFTCNRISHWCNSTMDNWKFFTTIFLSLERVLALLKRLNL